MSSIQRQQMKDNFSETTLLQRVKDKNISLNKKTYIQFYFWTDC